MLLTEKHQEEAIFRVKGFSRCCFFSGSQKTSHQQQLVLLKTKTTLAFEIQFWSFNEDNELKIDSKLCLEAANKSEQPVVMKCRGGGTQDWHYDKVCIIS